MNETLLISTLEIAIPLWVARFQENVEFYRQMDRNTLSRIVENLATEGDQLLYRDTKTAQRFNDLAYEIAWAACFVPGGIEFAGKKWEVKNLL